MYIDWCGIYCSLCTYTGMVFIIAYVQTLITLVWYFIVAYVHTLVRYFIVASVHTLIWYFIVAYLQTLVWHLLQFMYIHLVLYCSLYT